MVLKTALLSFMTVILFTVSSLGQSKKFNHPLADSLAKWVIVDQVAAGPPQGKLKLLSSAERKQYSDSIFAVHQHLLNAIFERYGYPGYDLVGEKGSNNFWLMVQHCDKFPEFQKRVLVAMKKQLRYHNADPKNFAYLTDRVQLNTGGKQVYGTQVTYNTDSCQARPKKLSDSLNVNKRRKEVGLEPLEVYLNSVSEMHFEMNRDYYEKKGIHKAKLITEPKAIR